MATGKAKEEGSGVEEEPFGYVEINHRISNRHQNSRKGLSKQDSCTEAADTRLRSALRRTDRHTDGPAVLWRDYRNAGSHPEENTVFCSDGLSAHF